MTAVDAHNRDYDGDPTALDAGGRTTNCRRASPCGRSRFAAISDAGIAVRAPAKRAHDELNTAEALDLVHQLADLGLKEVTLIGGEFYLRDDWDPIAAESAAAACCAASSPARGR